MTVERARTTSKGNAVLVALAGAPVFSLMAPAARASLARASTLVTMGAHELLWEQGARATKVGLVLSGRLVVTRGLARRDVIIEVIGPGQLLGEAAFSMNATHLYAVRCLRRARVALIPAKALRAVLEEQPTIAIGLALALGQQVLRLTRRLETLSSGSVETRLAKVMLGLAERHGEPFPGGTLVPVRLRREDLAALSATTLESASRHLQRWIRRGIMVQQPAGFLLKQPDLLRQLVGD